MDVKEKKSMAQSIKRLFTERTEMSTLLIFIAVFLLTGIMNPAFFTAVSMINLLRSISLTLIPCIGLTFALGCGEIDLSVGSMVALSGVVCGMCMKLFNLPIALSIFFALVVSALGGSVIGFVVVYFSVPPMIVTIGMQNILRGLVNVLTLGSPYANLPEAFNFIGSGTLLGLPFSIYLALVCLVIGWFLLYHTVFGRATVATGGNRETARLSGIGVYMNVIMVHVFCSVMAGIGGILTTARMGSAQVSVGTGLEMNAMAACIIGGTSMAGGNPTLIGTVIGVALMELLTVALTLVKVDVYWQKVILGVIIIVAVATDTYKRSRASSRG